MYEDKLKHDVRALMLIVYVINNRITTSFQSSQIIINMTSPIQSFTYILIWPIQGRKLLDNMQAQHQSYF